VNLPFTLTRIRSVEFFVCYDTPDGNQYWQIPVDDDVQNALREMLATTVENLDIEGPDFESLSLSQHYGSTERLVAEIDADVMQHVRTIYRLENIETNPQALREAARLAF
jgi:hypothetical protein